MADDNREAIPLDLGIIETSDSNDDGALTDFFNDGETPKSPVKKPENKSVPPTKKFPKKEEEKEEEEEVDDTPEAINEFLDEEEDENGNPKKKPSEKKEEGEEEEKQEEPSSDIEFKALAKEMFDLGVFSFDEGENEENIDIESPEDFAERFDYEKKKGAQEVLDSFLGRFGEPYMDMFENVFLKGVDPIEYLTRFARVQELETLDLTIESNQEQVIREKLKRDGLKPEEINRKVQRYRDYNDLEIEAKEAHALLLAKETKEKTEAAAKKEQTLAQEKARKTQYLSSVRSILTDKLQKKEFDGIPVDKPFAEEVGVYITKESWKLPDGTPLTEFDKEIMELRNNPELKVKVAMLMKLLKKDPTLSKIQKRAISKESSQLFSSLRSKEKKQQTKQEEQPNKWFT